jgi:lysophospholipase L1-like esterase
VLVEATLVDSPAPRVVRTLVVLGDSVGVGIGDPALGGGWRGFAPMLAEAMGEPRLVNLAVSGARVASVRGAQLPAAVAAQPDAAVLVVGMNDTMRSDFDPVQLCADLDRMVTALLSVGSAVVAVRYHDHSRIFRLPGPLRRMFTGRITQFNKTLDVVVARHRIGVVDLHGLPTTYERSCWAVDRLHPSEIGYRMLARAFAQRFAEAGLAIPAEVSADCSGGREIKTWQHIFWLIFMGIPWLCRRGRDLVPHALATIIRNALAGPDAPEPAEEYS